MKHHPDCEIRGFPSECDLNERMTIVCKAFDQGFKAATNAIVDDLRKQERIYDEVAERLESQKDSKAKYYQGRKHGYEHAAERYTANKHYKQK